MFSIFIINSIWLWVELVWEFLSISIQFFCLKNTRAEVFHLYQWKSKINKKFRITKYCWRFRWKLRWFEDFKYINPNTSRVEIVDLPERIFWFYNYQINFTWMVESWELPCILSVFFKHLQIVFLFYTQKIGKEVKILKTFYWKMTWFEEVFKYY